MRSWEIQLSSKDMCFLWQSGTLQMQTAEQRPIGGASTHLHPPMSQTTNNNRLQHKSQQGSLLHFHQVSLNLRTSVLGHIYIVCLSYIYASQKTRSKKYLHLCICYIAPPSPSSPTPLLPLAPPLPSLPTTPVSPLGPPSPSLPSPRQVTVTQCLALTQTNMACRRYYVCVQLPTLAANHK